MSLSDDEYEDKKVDIESYKLYFENLSENKNFIKKKVLLNFIRNRGISINDNRIKNELQDINDELSENDFIDLLNTNVILFKKIFDNDLIINNWSEFIDSIDIIYEKTKNNNNGKLADYIPQLKNVNEELYGISICTIDGQIYNKGDYENEFCVQSCSKPITYLIASELNGQDYIHNFVGREASGRNFNELCLSNEKIPHNPLINSGAIMCCSLIDYKNSLANRFDKIITYWSKLAANSKINFSTSVYLSERDSADRNNCLAYMMQESNAFQNGINKEKYRRIWGDNDLNNTLDFYFQCCSIEINSTQASIIASTLANGGVCPLTNERIFSNTIVKNALSLMSSCGMYDYSGEWAYTIGIPAKSGVSGIIMGIIPNVMGVAVFSPKLDELGNSSRGIDFFKELTKIYPFHIYDNILKENTNIILKKDITNNHFNIYTLLMSASIGDLNSIIILDSKGVDLNSYDYDKRTALHLACSEGHINVIEYLLKKKVDKSSVDRWGNTSIGDLNKYKNNLIDDGTPIYKSNILKYEEIIKLLEN